MKLMRAVVIILTGAAIGVTVFEAAFGEPIDWGVVAIGLAVSIAGIWVIAYTSERR